MLHSSVAHVVAKNMRFGIKTVLGSRCLCYFLVMGHGQNSLSFSFPIYKIGLYVFFLRLYTMGAPAIALTASPSTHSLLRPFQPQWLCSSWIRQACSCLRLLYLLSPLPPDPYIALSSFRSLLKCHYTVRPPLAMVFKTATLPLLPA